MLVIPPISLESPLASLACIQPYLFFGLDSGISFCAANTHIHTYIYIYIYYRYIYIYIIDLYIYIYIYMHVYIDGKRRHRPLQAWRAACSLQVHPVVWW